jgi:hypothetical protein
MGESEATLFLVPWREIFIGAVNSERDPPEYRVFDLK